MRGDFLGARDDRRESGGPAVGGREDFDISEKEVGGSQWGCRPVGGAWRGKGRKKILGISKKVVSLQVEEIMGLSNKLLRDKMIYWK